MGEMTLEEIEERLAKITSDIKTLDERKEAARARMNRARREVNELIAKKEEEERKLSELTALKESREQLDRLKEMAKSDPVLRLALETSGVLPPSSQMLTSFVRPGVD